jgi:hypothetical protein
VSSPAGGTAGAGPCRCGCCQGVTGLTPVEVINRPGLAAIAYRVGTHASFKRSLIAGLSSSDRPALADLGSRDDDDLTIALLDGWATVADVLTFYQERIANESYLATATERRSLLELGRLIGYELRPGVAASTWLAFEMETAPGAPATSTIDAGVKVQSVPGPDEKPQTFETTKAIEARAAWTALTARPSTPQHLRRGLLELYLEGTQTQLEPGDALLMIGSEREESLDSERWDLRLLDTVESDTTRGSTRVTWREPLGHERPGVEPAARGVQFFALRQRAALFGHNAPDPRILKITNKALVLYGNWTNFGLSADQVDLDAVYPKIIEASWVVFDSPPYREVSRVSRVTTTSVVGFALSAKCTRIYPDRFENIGSFNRRNTSVFAQSEALAMAERPLRDPVYGSSIVLGQLVPELQPGQAIAVGGRRQHLRLTRQARNLQLESEDGSTVAIQPGERLEVMAPPVVPGGTTGPIAPDALLRAIDNGTQQPILWRLRNAAGFEGSLTLGADLVALDLALDADVVVTELAFIDTAVDAVGEDDGRTAISLADALVNCYERTSVRINANVAPATHGETVKEVLGAGDAGQPYQRFNLKQAPLTHVSGATDSGTQSTLEVRVNDLLWREVPNLFGRRPDDRIYVTSRSDEGRTTIEFGDGRSGARLPTGRENVRATYRKGIGLDGLLAAGQLSQLMTRPLGVKGASNPTPATGGDDAEGPEDARQNAPLTVLTLGRTVSLRDYEDYARSFAGVAKALATWQWDGDARRIFITVAGPRGAAIPVQSETFKWLVASISDAGDPNVTFTVKSYRSAAFGLAVNIKVDEPTFVRETVLAGVLGALQERFSFEARAFGQSVELSDVIATVQAVSGVIAVDVDRLFRDDKSGPVPVVPPPRLVAARPTIDAIGDLIPAELLTLDLSSLTFGTMP